jgi:hypothetical protein
MVRLSGTDNWVDVVDSEVKVLVGSHEIVYVCLGSAGSIEQWRIGAGPNGEDYLVIHGRVENSLHFQISIQRWTQPFLSSNGIKWFGNMR